MNEVKSGSGSMCEEETGIEDPLRREFRLPSLNSLLKMESGKLDTPFLNLRLRCT